MPGRPVTDVISELRFALAEADTETPDVDLQSRVVGAAIGRRPAGRPVEPPDHIDGLEAFRRMTSRLEVLLGQLTDEEWAGATVRGLSVQQLVGHLIGVEDAFCATLQGDSSWADGDHVDSTEPTARRQVGLRPAETCARWVAAVGETIATVAAEPDPGRAVRMHRVALPLDPFLVVRAFEMWTHEEDIERATGRARFDPDPSTLARMTDLALALLPAGLGRAGGVSGADVRLVLTGPGGGTWDVDLGAGHVRRAGEGFQATAGSDLVVVDAAAFCRVVANRDDLRGSAAVTSGDAGAAEVLFAGAAALALD